MERKLMQLSPKRYKIPLMCLRWAATYAIFLFIAAHTGVYATGIIPGDIFTAAIVGILMTYRFLSIAIAPAVLVFWAVNALLNQKTK